MQKNYDTKEIEKFSRIAQEWWDETGKFKPLHDITPLRVQYLKSTICEHWGLSDQDPKPFGELKVLDIGCGGGLASVPMARLGAQVTGIDASNTNIQVAKTHAEKINLSIKYLNTTVEDLEPKEKFDIILALEVIEHVPDPKAFLSDAIKLLKPGGLIFVSTLNRNLKSLLLAKITAEYVLRWIPQGTHSWNKFIKPSELLDMLNESQSVRYKNIIGFKYKPLAREWRLSNDTSINYIMCASSAF